MAAKKRTKKRRGYKVRAKVGTRRIKVPVVVVVSGPGVKRPRTKKPKASSVHRAAKVLSNPDAGSAAKHAAAVTLGNAAHHEAAKKPRRRSRKKAGQASLLEV